MSQFTTSILLEGRAIPSPTPVRLHAGPLTMLLETANGFLRQIRLGDSLLLNGVYAAVRDQNWDTVEPVIRDLKIDQKPESFSIVFLAECRKNEIDFAWQGTITGAPDGTIRYSFAGEARSAFRRNRIGFCILHAAACAGQPCIVEHVDDRRLESRFPRFISPHQPFKQARAITHCPFSNSSGGQTDLKNVEVEVRMEGDDFETEDQRNWSDASFKTYCTPLDLPFPVQLKRGEKIRQDLTIRLSGFPDNSDAKHGIRDQDRTTHPQDLEPVTSKDPAGTSPHQRSGSDIVFHPLPGLGLSMASHDLPLNEIEIARLRALNLDHLRCDLIPLADGWEDKWNEAQRQATELGCRLHIAIHLSDDLPDEGAGDRQAAGHAARQLKALASIALEHSLVDAWMIFAKGEKATKPEWTERARSILGGLGGLIVGGTDANFTELNRQRPTSGSADAITWSVNPQVHAFDNRSLVETLETQWDAVVSARDFFEGELLISPITLRQRFNPEATSEPPILPPDVMPPQVDVRQMSLFGAAWTLGSIASLSRAPLLRSITYYETTGWRGVMEWWERPRLPHKFVTRPDWVFPMYFVFALLAGFDECSPVRVGNRLEQTALLIRNSARPAQFRLLVSSFDRDTSRFELPAGFTPTRQFTLSQENAVAAMRDPAEVLDNGWMAASTGSDVVLPPFALVALDGRSE